MTTSLPINDMTDDQLAAYVTAQLSGSAADEAEAINLGRRSSVALFRAGAALVLIRDRLKKTRDYTRWLKSQQISQSTAFNATKLFEKAKQEKNVEGLTITEARAKFGLKNTRRDKAATPATAPATTTTVIGSLVQEATVDEPKTLELSLAVLCNQLESFGQLDRTGEDHNHVNSLIDKAIGLLLPLKSVAKSKAA